MAAEAVYKAVMIGSYRQALAVCGAGTAVGLARRLIVLVALCAPLAGLGSSSASAQSFGFFGNLFGGGRPQQAPPNYPDGYGAGSGYRDPNVYGPRHTYAPRAHVRRHPPPMEQAKEPAKEKAPAKNATMFVDVFGDALGQQLANGLDDALSDRAEVGVLHKARGSSGLVSAEIVDWPKTIDALLDGKDRIDVAVMMIGSNDRQAIQDDGKSFAVGSNEWSAIYRKRVLAIDEAFRKKGVPLIWVGVPIIKNSDFADDMAAFNDIYREAAAKTGATYVDTWEAFSDDNGDFNAFGPDINGQTVRLRAADGIYFTRAGARKLAHFVEAHVRRDLDGKGPPPVAPSVPPSDIATLGDAKKASGEPAPAVKPEVGPINNLGQLPSAANGELARVAAHEARPERPFGNGEPQAAPIGRADNLRWPASMMPQP